MARRSLLDSDCLPSSLWFGSRSSSVSLLSDNSLTKAVISGLFETSPHFRLFLLQSSLSCATKDK